MQTGMNLQELLTTVMAQNAEKRDFVTSTRDNIRMVVDPGQPLNVASNDSDPEPSKSLKIIMLKEGAPELDRFGLTTNAHRQIASRLEIPWAYYKRLTHDYPELLCENVNNFFEREPKKRLLRVLGENVRAFLSDRYRPLDNQEVLEMTLPAVMQNPEGEHIPSTVLGGNLTSDHMNLKVLFEGDHLKHEITTRTRTGEPRIIQPGFRLTNSETGSGSLKFEAFFYDGYCLNGCVFGKREGFSFSRNHIGGALIEGVDYEVISDETRELQDRAIISQVADGIKAISDPVFVTQMAQQLKQAAQSEQVQQPGAAVDTAVRELDLRESEKESILMTFLQDADYSQFGLASAVTSVANDPSKADYSRANELENVGGKILSLSLAEWSRDYVHAVPIAA